MINLKVGIYFKGFIIFSTHQNFIVRQGIVTFLYIWAIIDVFSSEKLNTYHYDLKVYERSRIVFKQFKKVKFIHDLEN